MCKYSSLIGHVPTFWRLPSYNSYCHVLLFSSRIFRLRSCFSIPGSLTTIELVSNEATFWCILFCQYLYFSAIIIFIEKKWHFPSVWPVVVNLAWWLHIQITISTIFLYSVHANPRRNWYNSIIKIVVFFNCMKLSQACINIYNKYDIFNIMFYTALLKKVD